MRQDIANILTLEGIEFGDEVEPYHPKMRARRLIELHNDLKVATEIVRLACVEELIKAGYSGYVNYDDEVLDMLKKYFPDK